MSKFETESSSRASALSNPFDAQVGFITWKRLLLFFALGTVLATMSGCGVRLIPQANNDVEAAWSEVLNQYQRRADLVPNLVETVKGYAKHEQSTLTEVMEARAKATQMKIDFQSLNEGTLQQFQRAQGALSSALSRLLAVSENYPDLKANQNFRDLQIQLEGTENRVTIARNRYIEAIRGFNNLVTVPPESWVNSLFYRFEKKPQFTVENVDAIQKAPKVGF